MKKLLYPFSLFCLTLFVSSWSFGQSVFNVAVTNFEFTPSALTIEVGDTVRWTNVSGTHNVDGTIASYPSNPVGFANPADGSGTWVFDVVFTVPGTYQYECGVHGPNMPGSITVNSTTDISEIESDGVLIYPNPTKTSFTIEHKKGIESIEIFNLNGKRVLQLTGNSLKTITIDSNALDAGVYTYAIVCSESDSMSYGKIIKTD